MKLGFTLLELIIVIVVIGILASIALPQFTKTKERALGKEAIANLKLIAAAEKFYKMEMGNYYPGSAGATVDDETDINTALKLSLTKTNWNYYIRCITGLDFWAFAERKFCVYRISNNQEEPDIPDGCPCP